MIVHLTPMKSVLSAEVEFEFYFCVLEKGYIIEKVYLYKYKALNNTLAITNNNDFSIIVYSPLTGEEWEIVDGQTRLFDSEKYKDAEFIISDIVISKYGKANGYETMPQILGAFEQNLNLEEYITNTKFTVSAKEASSAKKYQFLIKANISDFTDKQPSLDLSQVIRNNELEDLFFDYISTKVFLSSYINNKDYIIGQYHLKSYRKDGEAGIDSVNFILESGSIIPPSIPKDIVEPNIIKNAHESELVNNYKLKELENYKLDTKVDIYNRVTEFKLVDKLGHSIVFDIDSYQDLKEQTILYLSIKSGIKNLIECTTTKCISDEDLEKFKFRLILTSPQKLYPDSDKDNIIDSVDMFPNKYDYQFDTDRDGMPDSWETQYGLNPNDPSDASKDLNKNGKTNLEEFTDGTDPKNTPPTANAGADKTITTGESVTLNGTGTDAEDATEDLSFEWTNKDGDVIGEEANVTIPSNRILTEGNYTFTLTVTDTDGASSSDEVVVEVEVVEDNSQDTNLTKGLVAHYEFEGDANDSSGNGNHGAEYGGVTYDDGVIGQAGSFDGVDDYVRIPNSSKINFLNDEDFSLNLWVLANENQVDTYYSDNDIIEKWSGGEGYPYVIRYMNKDFYSSNLNYTFLKGSLHGGQYNYDTKENKWVSSNILDIHNFTHIVFVKKLGRIYLYENGNLISNKDSNIGSIQSNSDLFIATRGNMENFFKGLIDDLRIYNRALNESEIKRLYEMGSQKVSFEDNFDSIESFDNNWTQTNERGTPSTYKIENGKLILTTNGGSDGYMGIFDSSYFVPNNLKLQDDFTLEVKAKELLREKTNNYKDNSGFGIYLAKTSSLETSVVDIGIGGNYSGYFEGYNYNEYNAHRISSYNPNTKKRIFVDEYDLDALYDVTFKIERRGDNFTISYKLGSNGNWISHTTTISIDKELVPILRIGSGDGGITRQNGKFSCAVDYIKVF